MSGDTYKPKAGPRPAVPDGGVGGTAVSPTDVWQSCGNKTHQRAEITSFRNYLVRQALQARCQHENRADGSFGASRNNPEEINFWKGMECAYSEVLDELDLRFFTEK